MGRVPNRRCHEGDTPMSVLDIVGLVLALGLFAYLVVALLYPERFE
jgi:K+-transporting ATPase KdpF subunit